MDVKSTRLRFISAPSPLALTQAVDGLPFKIEIKSINEASGRWIVYFVIPDNYEFNSLEL